VPSKLDDAPGFSRKVSARGVDDMNAVSVAPLADFLPLEAARS